LVRHVQIPRYFCYLCHPDGADSFAICQHERIVTEHIHQSRNSSRILGDGTDRFRLKRVRLAAFRSLPPVPDVMVHVRGRKRMNRQTHGDALLELPQILPVEQIAELGLARQDNLEQLAIG
jgi:hypothetical protein